MTKVERTEDCLITDSDLRAEGWICEHYVEPALRVLSCVFHPLRERERVEVVDVRAAFSRFFEKPLEDWSAFRPLEGTKLTFQLVVVAFLGVENGDPRQMVPNMIHVKHWPIAHKLRV